MSYKNIMLKNTRRSSFNCGGYALETFDWYCPSYLYGYLRTKEEKERFSAKAVRYMLDEFDDLRVINDVDELKDDEYAIAFRVGYDDFHYVKRADNGVWYHKSGGNPKIRRMKKDIVFGEEWVNPLDSSCTYDSKVVLFAKGK